jgi:predicted RNA-binding Zn ribbon-like protein
MMYGGYNEMNTFDLSGGHLALDFANTVGGTRARPTEHLHGYEDLLDWARQVGSIGDAVRRRLARGAERRPQDAAKALRRAVELREAIFRAFDARAEGRPEPAEAIATIDREARAAAAHRTLRSIDGRVERGWDDEGERLERPIWPIAVAAEELLVATDTPVIKECASETCDWLFIDHSRNRSRRWCDMNDCGNRAKARRFYARSRRSVSRSQG